jgi:HTH-type transcriptional regulator/antitoxin HigA
MASQKISHTFKPAQVFHPGDFLRDELAERGWAQSDFAKVIGRPLQVVNEIINNKKRLTAETAKAIALAFGTSPEFWLSLQNQYDLHSTPEADREIVKRAAKLAS